MEEKEFIRIIEDNKRRIYRLCNVYASNTYPSEDLFQEVVYQIWRSRNSFKGNSKIETWMYRIALNVCYGSVLDHKKKDEPFVKLDSIKVYDIKEKESREDDDRVVALQNCIKQLDKSDRSIVLLYLEEMKYKEISEIIGISENHVAVKMKRIKKKLLACLTPKINEDER